MTIDKDGRTDPDAVVGGLIRDRYVTAVERIAQADGVVGNRWGDHRVAADASRHRCLSYVLKFVVGKPEYTPPGYRYSPHWRYYELAGALRYASQIGWLGASPRVHIDLGCGPGTFVWAGMDSLGERSPSERFGFDHSKEMLRLAAEVWTMVAPDVSAAWYSNAEQLVTAIQARAPRGQRLVTLGFVLAETHDQPDTIRTFASVVERVLNSRGAFVVAVDARSAAPMFRKGWDALLQVLEDQGLRVQVPAGPFRSRGFAEVNVSGSGK